MTHFALMPVRGSHRFRREESDGAHEQTQAHKSVMVAEVVKFLAPKKGDIVVDATYGQGGHTKALKGPGVKIISIDADERAGVIAANFADLEKVLKQEKIKEISKAIFDLGWNRGQLADRGFSFMTDEPLLMSYSKKPRSGFFAKDILNTWSEKAIADVFFGYGEERYARKIARAVVARRNVMPIETTFELAELVKDNVPPAYRHGKTHPATKTFQALRIAVNDELTTLKSGLAAAWEHLSCGGRIAVISFHSTEDRIVKHIFAAFAKKEGTLILKKPLPPPLSELRSNPSARSAKLRVIEKTC